MKTFYKIAPLLLLFSSMAHAGLLEFSNAPPTVQLAGDGSLSVSSGSITGQLNVFNGTYAGALDTEVVQSSGTGRALNVTNNGTGNSILVTPKANTSASSSVGGAINLTNTSNDGAGLVIYTHDGASATGIPLVVTCDSSTFAQGCANVTSSGTVNAFTINEKGSGSSASGLNVTSVNPNASAAQITGVETGRGSLKITHTGMANGSDGNASGLSIDLQTAGTAAQGIFVDATTGGTTGNLLSLRNNGVTLGTFDSNGKLAVSASTTSAYEFTASTITTSFHVAISTSGHEIYSTTKPPTMGTCGSGPSVSGNDVIGVITTGTGAPTSCTLNFGSSYGVAPTCTFNDDSTTITGDISAISATSVTFSFSVGLTSGHIYYRCGCAGASCL